MFYIITFAFSTNDIRVFCFCFFFLKIFDVLSAVSYSLISYLMFYLINTLSVMI